MTTRLELETTGQRLLRRVNLTGFKNIESVEAGWGASAARASSGRRRVRRGQPDSSIFAGCDGAAGRPAGRGCIAGEEAWRARMLLRRKVVV